MPFHGLLAPSISNERFSTPFYSYWDDFYALSAWRNCEFLALAAGEPEIAARAQAKGEEFAQNLSRSLRMTVEAMGKKFIPSAADLQDVDPTSTSIAFEPCRVEDVLPREFLAPTYDFCAAQVAACSAPEFQGSVTPYVLRNLNAFVALGRHDDAFRLLEATLSWRRPRGWRHWAEVVWSPARRPEHVGDMPHTWIGAEFAAAIRRMLVREDGETLELLRAAPDDWWKGEGVRLLRLPTAFGALDLRAWRQNSQAIVELALTGPPPARVTLRYPGAKRAEADGKPCEIDRDVIASQTFRRLVIDF